MPAVGMLALPATVAGATTTHIKTTGVQPDVQCVGSHTVHATSFNGTLTETVIYGPGDCIWQQHAFLHREQTGLTERVRLWNHGNPNKLLRQTFQPGVIVGGSLFTSGSTYFSSGVNFDAPEICAALVKNGTSTVKYGPVCIVIP